jgi:hypothetical protein
MTGLLLAVAGVGAVASGGTEGVDMVEKYCLDDDGNANDGDVWRMEIVVAIVKILSQSFHRVGFVGLGSDLQFDIGKGQGGIGTKCTQNDRTALSLVMLSGSLSDLFSRSYTVLALLSG